jgi:hypothetical protein
MRRRQRESLTEQGKAERDEIDAWVEKIGSQFKSMYKHLEDHSLRVLVDEALLVISMNEGMTLPRICRRQKRAIICWFVEHDMDQLKRPQLRIQSEESGIPPPGSAREEPSAMSHFSWNDADALFFEDIPFDGSFF